MDVRHNVIQLRRREGHAGFPFQLGDLVRRHIGEGIVARGRTIGVETEDAPSQVGVVGRRTAELIIWLTWPKGTSGQVLQLPAPTLVADLHIKLAIGTEQDLAAIVIAPHGLTGVRLKRPQHNNVFVQCQRLYDWVPDVSINAIAQQWHVSQIGAVGICAALRPVEIHAMVVDEIGI